MVGMTRADDLDGRDLRQIDGSYVLAFLIYYIIRSGGYLSLRE